MNPRPALGDGPWGGDAPIAVHVYDAIKRASSVVDAPELRVDDSVGDVSRKLTARLGAPAYWCVWSSVPPDGYLDGLQTAASDPDAAALGPGTRRKRAAAGMHWCPYAVAGHPAALPSAATPVDSQAVLEQLIGDPDGYVVACVAPSAAWAGPATADDGTEAGLAALLAVTTAADEVAVGTASVTVDHSLVAEGATVSTGALDLLHAGLALSTDAVTATVLHRADGTLSFRGWAAAARAGVLTAADVERDCRTLIRGGEEELRMQIACPDAVAGTARVHVSSDLTTSVVLRTAGEPVAALRAVLATPALMAAVRVVTGAAVPPVADDAMDVSLRRYASRHTLAVPDGTLAAFADALDRAAPLLVYTRTDAGLEVTLSRTPSFAAPSAEGVFIMRRQYLVSQGRTGQLLKDLGARFSLTDDQARAELAAYEASRPARVHRGTTLPGNKLLAVVTPGASGVSVTLECECELRYARRLMWCLRRVTGLRRAEAPIGASVQQLLRAAEAASASGPAGRIPGKYVLNRLYAADRELFSSAKPGFSLYAKTCGAVDGRQPIAVTPGALAEMRAAGDREILSYDTRGTSYICPEVWCPATQTAMTLEAYVAAGSACPGGGPGLDLTRAKYWRGATGRFPGPLGAIKHPDGLCMPCCFKRPQGGTEKTGSYVLGASSVPLPVGRLGETTAFADLLRRGVQGGEFMEALAAALQIDRSEVVADLQRAVSTAGILRVGRGGVLARFIDARHAPLREPEFADFLETAAGRAHAEATMPRGPAGASRARSLALYDAAERYREHLRSPAAGHAFVLPLLRLAYPDVLVAVAEAAADGATVVTVVHTPLGGPGPLAAVASVRMIYKQAGTYEPLVARRGRSPVLRPGDSAAAAALAAHLQSRDAAAAAPLGRLEDTLRRAGRGVRAVVLSASDFAATGVLLEDPPNLYVPLDDRDPGGSTREVTDFVWESDLPAAVSSALETAAAIAVLNDVADDGGRDDLLELEVVESSGGVAVALRTRAGAIVPLSAAPEVAELFRDASDAVVQFARAPADAASPVAVAIAGTDALAALLDAMRAHLLSTHLQEMWVLNHPMCPYPRETRAARLLELTSPVWSGAGRDVVARAVNMLMTHSRPARPAPEPSEDVLTATADDVIDGTLSAAIAALSLPEDHVDVVRHALAAHVAADPVSTFSKPMSLAHAWASPARGLDLFGAADGVDAVSAVASVAAATGLKPLGTTRAYAGAAVADIARAVERGESIESLGLHRDVERLAVADAAAARSRNQPMTRRLKTRLAADAGARVKVGRGDVARALSGPHNVAVVLSPTGSFVAGSGNRVTVVLLTSGGHVVIGTRGGQPLLPRGDLPRGIAALVAAHVRQKSANSS